MFAVLVVNIMDSEGLVMETGIDAVVPGQRWEFDREVTEVFDNMLERSIPNYAVMRQLVTDLSRDFLDDGGVLVDLGASRGNAVAPLLEGVSQADRAVCVEVSPPMIEVLEQRFADEISAGRPCG
ncbi:hypothetical protein GCM10009595_04700 [Falsarthrobacter nasiphocae]